MVFGVSIKLLFAILSTILAFAGGFFPYIRDILQKKTQPHAYTWLIWSITQGTAVAGLWYGKGGWGALSLTIGTLFVFVVFLLSLKYGTKNITKGDTITLVAAFLAILVWIQLHNPLYAIIMVSIIDVVGYWPSLRKTFSEPWTETPISWIFFALTNILAMLALNEYSPLTLTYLIAISIANVCLYALCMIRRKTIPQTTEKPV